MPSTDTDQETFHLTTHTHVHIKICCTHAIRSRYNAQLHFFYSRNACFLSKKINKWMNRRQKQREIAVEREFSVKSITEFRSSSFFCFWRLAFVLHFSSIRCAPKSHDGRFLQFAWSLSFSRSSVARSFLFIRSVRCLRSYWVIWFSSISYVASVASVASVRVQLNVRIEIEPNRIEKEFSYLNFNYNTE